MFRWMNGDAESAEQVGEGEHFTPVDAANLLGFVRHGRSSEATFTTRFARSRKTASIVNRMKAVWIDAAGRSSRPSPEGIPLRPSSPRRRANGVSARRHRSQTTVPSSFASAIWGS